MGQHCPAWTGGVAEVTAEQRRTQSLASEPATARANLDGVSNTPKIFYKPPVVETVKEPLWKRNN